MFAGKTSVGYLFYPSLPALTRRRETEKSSRDNLA
jgi:hypothetical protein